MDHESQIQIYMTDLLEEMKKLNETFNADIEGRGFYILFCGNKIFLEIILSCTEWDLLDSLKELVKVQSDSLTSLKPTISYIVNNNRFNTATQSGNKNNRNIIKNTTAEMI